ncbi:MAG: diguanylate cyclase, partial [Burkholderiales bacterium]
TFAQSLAVQSAVLLQKRDLKTLQLAFDTARKHDPSIRSIAVRKADWSLPVKSGDHAKTWTEPEGGNSTPTDILIPLMQDKKRWGRFEIAYTAADENTLADIALHPLAIVVMHFIVVGSLFYWLYLRRALSVLDPSAVIPERVRTAFNTMTEGVVVLDRKGRVLMTNNAFDMLPAAESASVIGKKLSAIPWLAGGLPGDAAQHPWVRTMEKGTPSTGHMLVINSSSGQARQLMVNCSPVLDAGGKVRGCVVTFDDVSTVHLINERLTQTLHELQVSRNEVERKNAELEYTATHDSLSGCFTRLAGIKRLGAAMQQAGLDGQPLAVFMMDIDNFKAVNDGFGHGTGDQVVQAVGAALLATLRETDIVSRHGGDEFVVTLPKCGAEEAMAIAQSVRQAIRDRCALSILQLAGFSVTVSIGLAVYRPETDQDLSALMLRADAALYEAKAAGRDTAVLASPLAEKPRTKRSSV